MIALEMANKLLEQGEKVPLLFLIDAPGRYFPLSTLTDTALPKNGSFRSRVVYHSRKLASMPLDHKIAYTLRKLPNGFKRIRKIITQKPKKKIKMFICNVYRYLGLPLPLPLRSFYLMKIYTNTIYTPKLNQGRIILCHSDQGTYEESLRNMITGEVEVHQIIGADHQNILNEPYVRLWAGHLNGYLRELQVKGKGKKG
jgi:thioesterase domain-containing protein